MSSRLLLVLCVMMSLLPLGEADIATGIVSTWAGVEGNTGSYSGDGGQKELVHFKSINSIWMNTMSQMYIADQNNYRIRKVDIHGVVSTVFGTGSSSMSGDKGPAVSASGTPAYVCGDSVGNVYFSDYANAVVRKIAKSGVVTAFAGGGTLGSSTSNADNGGAATASQFSYVTTCQVDTSGDVYMAITNYSKVKKVTALTGVIRDVIGTGAQASPDTSANNGNDGPATAAKVALPIGLWLDSSNVMYVASYSSGNIRAVSLDTGVITAIAGTGTSGFSGDGGAATSAKLTGNMISMAGDGNGLVYVSCFSTHRIRVLDTTAGTINTLGGTGVTGFAGNGAPVSTTQTQFRNPSGIIVYQGALLVAEPGNNVIRLIGDDTWTLPTTAAPTLTPTAVPSVVPTEVPTLQPTRLPTVMPSAAPSIVPSAAPTTTAPSRLPTIAPTPAPSKTPTLAPSRTPTRVPTALPTQLPTFAIGATASPSTAAPSVVPTRAPTAVPTTRPTEAPTMQPSGPTDAPTVRPSAAPGTHRPTVAPTCDVITISFEAALYLHNTTDSYMDLSCKQAVVAAVAQTLNLTSSQVTYVSQEYISDERRRRLRTQSHFQMMVAVEIEASSNNFQDTMCRNASYLYTKLYRELNTAVDNGDFTTRVRARAAYYNAAALRHVGNVNMTATEYDDITHGRHHRCKHCHATRHKMLHTTLGIVIIALIALSCCWCCWFCCYGCLVILKNNRNSMGKVYIEHTPVRTPECRSPA